MNYSWIIHRSPKDIGAIPSTVLWGISQQRFPNEFVPSSNLGRSVLPKLSSWMMSIEMLVGVSVAGLLVAVVNVGGGVIE